MNFKDFLNESKREVSDKDRKIAEDIENSLKEKLTQKFLDDILNKAIKDKVISKTSTPLKKFGESKIRLISLQVVPIGKGQESEGRILVGVEVSPLRKPDISILGSVRGFKDIESIRKAIREQVTNELIEVLRKQATSQEKYETKVIKNAWSNSVFLTLTYE